MQSYWAQTFVLPKKVIDEVNRILKRFLWSGPELKSLCAKVAWDVVCRPRINGGLGFPSLEMTNLIAYLKHIWKLFARRKESLWVAWSHRYLIKAKSFWTVKSTTLSSGFWRRLLKLRDMARGLLKHKIGKGTDTMMWLDYWLPNGPILNQISPNDGEILQLDLRVKVDRLISLNHWEVPNSLAHIPFFQSQSFQSQLDELPNPSPEADSVIWLPSPNFNFSLAHTINYLLPPTFNFTWYKTIWFKHHIPKHSFITWLAIKGRLYTLDRKPMRHKHYINTCYLCLANCESLDHLFFQCQYSKAIWSYIQHSIGLYIHPSSWNDLITWCSSHWSSMGFLVHKLLLSAAVYFLWMERNNRAFRNSSSPPNTIISQIRKSIRGRLASIKLKKIADLRNINKLDDLQKLFMESCSLAHAQALITD